MLSGSNLPISFGAPDTWITVTLDVMTVILMAN
jgi:hypothetical protein